MADFKISFDKTMGHEGGYSDDPVDMGGETYKGISRRFHPEWNGWAVIDEVKKTLAGSPVAKARDLNRLLENNVTVQQRVRELYKQLYWNPFRGDDMPQSLAEEMFDTSVNLGVGRTIRYLQIALNVMNRNATLYPDMVVDGAYGPTTHKLLHTYLDKDDVGFLVKIINILQGAHYIEFMTKSPEQERFARGWLNRVTFSKIN